MEDQAEKLREIMRQKSTDTGQEKEKSAASGDLLPKMGSKTRIITITSGKGGVGKTNMSVNMALAYARLGKKVVVMDADLGLANVNIMLNMVPRYTLYDMIRKKKTMKEIMVETEYGISIVAGA